MAAGQSIKALALGYLARREHSRAELQRKLESKLCAKLARAPAEQEGCGPVGVDDDTPSEESPTQRLERIGQTLDELAARGLLSDARAAELVLVSQGRRYGSRRLKQSLQAKGLAPELVAAVLQQSKATEYERARAVWQRRFGAPAPDAAGRAKQARFLAGRGFDAEVIRRLVKGQGED